jgi:hypothetical protein
LGPEINDVIPKNAEFPETTGIRAPDSDSRVQVSEKLPDEASIIAQTGQSDAEAAFAPSQLTNGFDIPIEKKRKRRLKINPTPKNIIGICLRRITIETIDIKKRILTFLSSLPSNERSGSDADLIDTYLDQMFAALVRVTSTEEADVTYIWGCKCSTFDS